MQILDEQNFKEAVALLVERDKDLRGIIEKHGEPHFFARAAGFPTLVHLILEQQVSLASAKATFERTKEKLNNNFNPDNFLRLSEAELKQLGYSRQKSVYSRNLAQAVSSNALDLNRLEVMPDEAVKSELIKLKGIGNWTADVYLLMALRRADAFPVGDLGLIVGVQHLKELSGKPSSAELEAIGELWRPFRAVATRIIWHLYLKEIRPYSGYL